MAKVKRKKSKPINISDSEWHVMEVLWDHGPMKMAAIIEVLMPQTNWSRTTIATLTSRLENKGYIGTDRQERAFTYIPLISRKKARHGKLNDLIDQVFGGKADEVVKLIIDDGKIDDKTFQKFQRRIKKKKK
ncbi:MAG: BlaI/MecI/CopY family transcriptional regulator [Fastidiosipilaceae bacterium]|nr:BlaI/MecI/CopY family transcriptional regulator [Clostridiaceae bacterium]